jgi:hypothetical protein
MSNMTTAPFLVWMGWCNGDEEAYMGTSQHTKKPKPKPSQPAGKGSSGKEATQQRSGATGSSVKVSSASVTVKPAAAAERTQPPVSQAGKRDQKREARREEITRKLDERRRQREAELRRQRTKKWLVGGSIAAVTLALGAFIFYQMFLGPSVAAYLKGATIDGIRCDTLEQSVAHYHAHLQVYVNGESVQIPNDVGRQTLGCFYWLHTHDIQGDEGVIHIEAPSQTTQFHLYQFFDIWGQQWTATNFMGNKIDATHTLTAYVYTPDASQQPDDSGTFTSTPPGNLQPYTGDLRQITLAAHQIIALEYGTPTVPPQAFTFPSGE